MVSAHGTCHGLNIQSRNTNIIWSLQRQTNKDFNIEEKRSDLIEQQKAKARTGQIRVWVNGSFCTNPELHGTKDLNFGKILVATTLKEFPAPLTSGMGEACKHADCWKIVVLCLTLAAHCSEQVTCCSF